MDAVKEKPIIYSILKGVIISLIVSIFGVLFFAIILKFVDMGDTTIKIINQIIKVASILFGCIIGFKKNGKNGLYKGIVLGLLYSIFAFLIFSILNQSFVFNASIVFDTLFGGVVGGICGIIVINSKSPTPKL